MKDQALKILLGIIARDPKEKISCKQMGSYCF
jgi:hypothetical protein